MNQLQKLARGLYQLAAEKADDPKAADKVVRHTLSKGLRIAITYRGGEWAISFWRMNSVPSLKELEVLRRDFSIPESALGSGEKMKRVSQSDVWRGYIFSWHGPRERQEQGDLFGAALAATEPLK